MKRSILVKIAPFWVLAVIVGSFMPYGFKHHIGTAVDLPNGKLLGPLPLWHRIVHFAVFGSTSGILVLIARQLWQRVAALASVLVLSLSIEYGQNLIDHYGIEWWDVRDDSLAAAAVFLILLSPTLRDALVRDSSRGTA